MGWNVGELETGCDLMVVGIFLVLVLVLVFGWICKYK